MNINQMSTLVKDSINEIKDTLGLSKSTPLNAINEAIETISNKPANLDVTNGTLYNYKSDSNLIPANTLIDLVSSYSLKSYKNYVGTAQNSRICNIAKFRSNKIIGMFGKRLVVYKCEDNTLIEEFVSAEMFTAPSYANPYLIIVLNDNLILHINYNTGYLIEVTDDYVCTVKKTISSIGGHTYKAHCVVKDNIAYVHLFGQSSASSAYSDIKYLQINLASLDYSLGSQYTVRSVGYNSTLQGNQEVIDDDTFIYNVTYSGSLYVTKVKFNYSTLTYSKTAYTALTGFTSGYTCFNWINENEGFIIYTINVDSTYELHRAHVILSGTSIILSHDKVISTSTGAWNYLTIYKINNTDFLLTYRSSDNSKYTTCRVFRGDNNTKEMQFGNDFVINVDETVNTRTEHYNYDWERKSIIIIDDNTLIYTVASYMGVLKINDFNIVQLTGDEVRIKQSTGVIKGITKTECTVEKAGEVWMLN